MKKIFLSVFFLLWQLIFFAQLVQAALPSQFNHVYFFGDGWTDQGEYHPRRRVPCFKEPAPQVNKARGIAAGKTWAASFAEKLYLEAIPASQGGNDWATVGAQTADILHQTQAYLNSVNQQADPEALYIIWGGSEDFFKKVAEQHLLPAQVLIDGVEEILESVEQLAAHGAHHILLIGLQDISLLPFINRLAESERVRIRTFCEKWNKLLLNAAPYLKAHFSNLILYGWDPMPLMQAVHLQPSQFNFPDKLKKLTGSEFKNDTAWWCGANRAADPDDYLFFGPLNPSTAFHELFAKQILLESNKL